MRLSDQKGSASVLTLFMVLCIFSVMALVVDLGQTFCTKTAAKGMLNLALRSASAQLDEEELKNANLVIDEARAAQVFADVLRSNLNLDAGLNPQPGSILKGRVTVNYFKVVNTGEVPFTYTFGSYTETVTCPAVVGIISFPVKSGMFSRLAGSPEETTMYCHATVAPELISRPIDEI